MPPATARACAAGALAIAALLAAGCGQKGPLVLPPPAAAPAAAATSSPAAADEAAPKPERAGSPANAPAR